MPIITDRGAKSVAIIINSSSEVVEGGNQVEFNFNDASLTENGYSLISTHFIEYMVELPAGKSVKILRKANVGEFSATLPMSYTPDILKEVTISQSIAGLAIKDISFTGSLIFRTTAVLSVNQEVKIFLLWQ